MGKIRFASYAPDTSQSIYNDAVFKLMADQQVVAVLPGMDGSYVRKNETFNKVEAVSFPDYNLDSYDDIIIICSYLPGNREDSVYSEARIYYGSSEGRFFLENSLTKKVNAEVPDKTIQNILSAIQQGTAPAESVQKEEPVEPQTDSYWKRAFADYVQTTHDPNGVTGYRLIYIDSDDIPELAVIGSCEAAGSSIVTYTNRQTYETELYRLGFSYIEKENMLCNSEGLMDSYKDRVYSMIDGQLTLIAEGNYGVEDYQNKEYDNNGRLVYKYFWNGIAMAEEDYISSLNEIYDKTKATEGYDRDVFYSAEELLAVLESN